MTIKLMVMEAQEGKINVPINIQRKASYEESSVSL